LQPIKPLLIKPLVKEIKTNCSVEELFSVFVDDPFPFWLDSSLAGKMGRYSFMGSRPFLLLKTWGHQLNIYKKSEERGKELYSKSTASGSPFKLLKEILHSYRLHRDDLPFPFLGGAVGFFSYDLGRIIEKIPEDTVDDLKVPDIYLGFYDSFLVVDHLENRVYAISSGLDHVGREGVSSPAGAEEKIGRLLEKAKAAAARQGSLPDPWEEEDASAEEVQTHFDARSYREAVVRAKEYIAAGDIYQVNLTQRLEVPLKMAPFQLYRRLRQRNPAPFASYLDCGGELRVISSSPERFLFVQDSHVETRPIKGTRPRGRTAEEDEQMRSELLNSEKDKAELVMIVDLERNDLGRVCSYGTVRVPQLIELEEYASVFHLVSTVTGTLAPNKDMVDLVRATFPGGSITGTPKIRAMEIIDELEPVRRGIYTGSIGYIGFDGTADLNIVIRTFVNKGDRLYLQVGGGIVADSDPQMEYEETLHKARAPLRSLGIENFSR